MKTLMPSVVLLATMLAGIFFIFTAVRSLWYAPDSELAVPEPQAEMSMSGATSTLRAISGDYPVRLRIPSLDISADVERVGLNAKEKMAVPSTYHNVAWYKLGTVPGDMGSAVMDGHVDNGLGLSGVFKRLKDINEGDDVFVEMKMGETLHFSVERKEIYSYTSVPEEELFARDDGRRLNLVTCMGRWVKGGDTYDHRLVVYTMLKP